MAIYRLSARPTALCTSLNHSTKLAIAALRVKRKLSFAQQPAAEKFLFGSEQTVSAFDSIKIRATNRRQ